MESKSVFGIAALALALLACDAHADPLLTPFAGAASTVPAPWHVVGLPQQTKPFTQFSLVDFDGHHAVRIEADRSYGNLVHPLAAVAPSAHLSWSWRIERPLDHVDLHEKAGDDSPVKVCVSFDEPMDSLSFGERQWLRIARSRSVDPVPTATVCYVWDTGSAVGSEIDNAFTRRLRYIVLENSSAQNRWVVEKRDLGADFIQAFGGESASAPPIVGVAIGADADNTKGHSVSYVSDLSLTP